MEVINGKISVAPDTSLRFSRVIVKIYEIWNRLFYQVMIHVPALVRKTVINGMLRIILLASQWVVSQGFGDSDMKLRVNSRVFVITRIGTST